MPQVNDLRIGRYDIRVTADAGASVTFTWPEGWESVTWTATLGETSLTVDKDGLDVTVTITAEQASALDGRPGTWTLLGDGVPEIRGNVYPSGDGSHHGNTAKTTTIVVDDAAVTVTVLGAAPSDAAGGVLTVDDARDGAGIMWIAHRGAPNLFPEHSMEAYRACVARGATVIEADAYLLSDGRVGVMHDTTIDRTTNGSGNTADQDADSWTALRIDDGDRLGGVWAGTRQPLPFLEDVIREFGNKVVLAIEAKNSGCGAAIANLLQQHRVHPRAAMVASFSLSELSTPIAMGYVGQFLGTGESASTLVSAGVEQVCYSYDTSPGTFEAALSAGLEVGAFTVNYHVHRDAVLGYGATFIYTDDPWYLASRHPKRLTDPYASGEWADGMVVVRGDGGAARGTLTVDGHLHIPNVFSGLSGCLQGWMSPLDDPTSFVLTFTVKFNSADEATRWFTVDVNVEDALNRRWNNGIGYRFIARKDGHVTIWKGHPSGDTLLGTGGGTVTPISDGGTASYKITVSPTSVKFERTDIANSIEVNDTSHRGEYVAFGANLADVEFYDVTLS